MNKNDLLFQYLTFMWYNVYVYNHFVCVRDFVVAVYHQVDYCLESKLRYGFVTL